MDNSEKTKYAQLILSMAAEYLQQRLSWGTLISNLKIAIAQMEVGDNENRP